MESMEAGGQKPPEEKFGMLVIGLPTVTSSAVGEDSAVTASSARSTSSGEPVGDTESPWSEGGVLEPASLRVV